jgi:hypothetical protein
MIQVSQFARRCRNLRRTEIFPKRFGNVFHFRNVARKLIEPPGFAKVNSTARSNFGMGTGYAESDYCDESGCGGSCDQ